MLEFGTAWRPEPKPINCPRTGCETTTEVNAFGRLRTHKLPDGWRTCAASGKTPDQAGEMDPPQNPDQGMA